MDANLSMLGVGLHLTQATTAEAVPAWLLGRQRSVSWLRFSQPQPLIGACFVHLSCAAIEFAALRAHGISPQDCHDI
eukprot:5892743-Amphidinium_carterae.1